MNNLAVTYWDQGRYAESELLLLRIHEALRDNPQAPAQWKREAVENLVRLYETWGKPGKAAAYRALLAKPGGN